MATTPARSGSQVPLWDFKGFQGPETPATTGPSTMARERSDGERDGNKIDFIYQK